MDVRRRWPGLSRWLALPAVATAVLIAGLLLHRFWLRQLSHLTGEAEWVWVTDVLERAHPVASLFVGTLTLPMPPPSALLKICGDREYVVYVNGTPAACGWSRPGYRLDLYDVAHLLRQGENTVAVEVRSPTSVGALLLALDVDGVGRNLLVSGPALVSRPRFSLATTDPLDAPVPLSWGSPPHFPWGYPKAYPFSRTLDQVVVEEPLQWTFHEARSLDRGGIELRLPRPVFGYLWLEFDGDGLAYVSTIPESLPGSVDELRRAAQPAVRLRGQQRWLDPEPRLIAGVFVFGRCVPTLVEIWPVPEELRTGAPGAVQGKLGRVQRTRWTTRMPPG